MGAYLIQAGTFQDQVVAGSTSAFPARSVIVFAKVPPKDCPKACLSEMPLSDVIAMVAVVPSALRLTVVGSVEPLEVWMGIAFGLIVEGRMASEKTASIGATRTTLVAPVAGIKAEVTTCGGVRSTMMVAVFDVMILPLVLSCAVTV